MWKRALVIALLAGFSLSLVVSDSRPAAGVHQFFFFDKTGDSFATFGANEAVSIEGAIEFINVCPEGTQDFIFPAADVYIVSEQPSGTLGDVTGSPNTVIGGFGGFFGDIIGFTLPSGSIPPGTYGIVFDECQDGKFDSFDFFAYPAFEVVIDVDVDSLPWGSFSDLKATAGQQAQRWKDAYPSLQAASWLAVIGGIIGPSTLPTDTLIAMVRIHPASVAVDAARNMAKHYRGLELDPPDPAFAQPTPVRGLGGVDPESNDALTVAMADLAFSLKGEAALAQALLRAVERYQGAQMARDGRWAHIQANSVRDYADLLSQQLAATNAGLSGLNGAVQAQGSAWDDIAALLQAEQARVAASGFTEDEVLYAANLGIGDADLAIIQDALLRTDFSSIARADFDQLVSDIVAERTALAANLQAFSADVSALIAGLAANPLLPNVHPVADAGGPYVTDQGASLLLNASASSAPDGDIVSYAWDLDGDGQFDDASGLAPTAVFDQAGETLIGLRVIGPTGIPDLAYTRVTVNSVNSRPVIDSVTPDLPRQTVGISGSISFSATVSDPDGDAVAVQWLLNGTPAATGTTFDFTPTAADLGLHEIQLVATDSSPFAASVRHYITVNVVLADDDGDGYDVSIDCDDNDPDVNPGQPEIVGNGKDDDCDAATSDIPVDADGDGYFVNVPPADCDDSDPAVNPEQTEVQYNGKDDDCDPSTLDGEGLILDATVRDFKIEHPDFEGAITGLVTGLVEQPLGADQKPVLAQPYGRGAITGPDTFNQWYNDVPGINLTTTIPLTLIETAPGSGIYSYSNSSFFPINGQLWGNEGLSDNYHFTLELHTAFTYRGGESFNFTGDDDVWVFINNSLAIDLGGVHGAISSTVNLDSLGLTVGETYPLDLFFAERHLYASNFNITTGLVLGEPPPEPPLGLPVADAGGPYVTSEGGSVTLDGMASSDPDGEIVEYEWDLDNDGQFDDAVGETVILLLQDDASFTIGLRVTDDDGQTATDTAVVTVLNLAPTLNAGPDAAVNDTFSLPPAWFADDGVPDTHTATIDWGDGTVEGGAVGQSPGSGTVSGTHTYAADGTYTVEVCVTDDDGGVGCDSLTVTTAVTNVVPAVLVDEEHAYSEGDLHAHAFGFADENPDDTHTAMIDWGDGSAPEVVALNDYGSFGTAFPSHAYPDNGDHTVVFTVCDQALDCHSQSAVEHVNNLPPDVTAGPDQTVDKGDPLSLTLASFSDPGTGDTHTATIDWGDGPTPAAGVVDETDGAGTVNGSHMYGSAGEKTVQVCVTDDDGATACASLRVMVLDPPDLLIQKLWQGVDPLGQPAVTVTLTGPGFPSGTDCAPDLIDGSGEVLQAGDCDFDDIAEGAYTATELVAGNSLVLIVSFSIDSDGNPANGAQMTLAYDNDLTLRITNATVSGGGCSPGFWKTHSGLGPGNQAEEWPATRSPHDLLAGVFNVGNLTDLNDDGIDDSLWDALGFGGGSGKRGAASILLRAAVAAMLNAEHPDVGYPRTAAEVVSDVNAALVEGRRGVILELAGDLDLDNNLGCTVVKGVNGG